MGVRKQYDYKNSRLPDFTSRFRKIVDEIGGVTKASEITGISRPTINFWYNGQRTPDAENLKNLSESFHIRADWFLGLTPTQTIDENIAVAAKTTGLSETAIEKLCECNDRTLGLVSDLIEAKEFEKVFNAITEFIKYGTTTFGDTFVTYADPSQEELDRVKRYIRDSGREIVTNDIASAAALKIASDTFQDIFNAVLQEEKAKEDSKK